jgi:hypothetical protein
MGSSFSQERTAESDRRSELKLSSVRALLHESNQCGQPFSIGFAGGPARPEGSDFASSRFNALDLEVHAARPK